MDRFPSARAGYAEAYAAALLNNRTIAQKMLFQTHRLAEQLSSTRMHRDVTAGCTCSSISETLAVRLATSRS
jgi:hypothetical protein